MNVYSVNQVNQVYVAKALKTALANLTDVGDLLVKATADKDAIYFQHKGAGGIVRSDLIKVKNILWGKATKADDMSNKLGVAEIKLDPNVNGGKPIAGEDYIMRITFPDGYIGISPEDSTYWKHGAVHAISGMSASDFYKKMAISVAKNLSREARKIISVWVDTSTEVLPNTKESDLTGTYTSIILKEVEQDWILGTKWQKPMKFLVNPTEVYDGVDNLIWGTVTYSDGDTVKNGKMMADYEYFHMGARGDMYRKVGFPNYVPTTYLVDPTQEYDTIGLHFCYVGANESVQKSEKDITLIVPKGQAGQFITAINNLIKDSGVEINTI